jgi:hypothetical protein
MNPPSSPHAHPPLNRLADAKRAYEGFVRVKDNLRIRMPVEPDRVIGGTYKPPRMDFNMGKGVIRSKQTAIPQNTVEMMRGSGLKYVHTLTKGKQGNKGDLEKVRMCKEPSPQSTFLNPNPFFAVPG